MLLKGFVSRYKNTLLVSRNCINRTLRSSSTPAYIHRVGNKPLIYRSVGQQLEWAVEKYGHHLAIISCHEQQQLSFVEAQSQAEILAIKLKDLGMQRGDHLGIWATNSVQWYITFLAAALSGYSLVCMNPAWQASEVEYALQKAKIKMLVTMDECGKQNFYGILKELIPTDSRSGSTIQVNKFPSLRAILMRSSKDTVEFTNFEQLLNTPTDAQDIEQLRLRMGKVPVESPLNIQFTSGTTGKSKAAQLTHFNIINQADFFGASLGIDKERQRICLPLPLFHVFGLSVAVAGLCYGSTVVLPSPTFNSAAAIDAITKEQCNVIVGTPTMFVDLLDAQRRMQKPVNSLQLGMIGGAACSPEVFQQVKSVFGLKSIRIGYGLSESAGGIFAHDGTEEDSDAAQTVGKIFGHGEAKVVNSEGETVAFGETGELCVRGFFNMNGYFEDEEKTKEVLSANGWLKTGDEFMMHSDGTAYVMGRKKDMIIRGGENIFPKEIEDLLDTHSSVLEAQVIGVPDERLGEEICVYLRLKADAPHPTVEGIRSFLKGKLAHFKIPRYVRIVDEFPKTASGKIQKFKLKELYQRDSVESP